MSIHSLRRQSTTLPPVLRRPQLSTPFLDVVTARRVAQPPAASHDIVASREEGERQQSGLIPDAGQ